ncbi:RNA polymerase sigma-70 factor [Pseudoflavitalea sp. G-6-1-2]|uniref:RNA polymerase sigma-70 factor n=1 Tax=Pseudoflavitalea sp. G-6-1-2 TaxID=2728841 RepID=UPI00146DF93C|nr:RNA polymerase sigma-70 factor [Pseudoflavitalea sp. G-6-1-2]NML20522.1 RNA polymerase sigma-70 factor [Pseudoflavitalea sp. G-6-1-2]
MERSTSYCETQLLHQLADGSDAALRQLFKIYRDRLFFYIAKITKSEQVAEELVMDVFMKIWTHRSKMSEVDNFDSYLFRIARNKSIDFLRSAAGNARLQELLWDQIQAIAANDHADTRLLVKEFESKQREAVLALSPQRRKVYTLRHDEQLSHEEIASQLNVSRYTVNNHLVEAQKFVHRYLAQNMDLAMVLLIAKIL